MKIKPSHLFATLLLTACSSLPAALSPNETVSPTAEQMTAPGSTPRPLPSPTSSPTAIVPVWNDTPLLDPSSPFTYSNKTEEYRRRNIYAGEFSLGSDTRITLDIQVEPLGQDSARANAGIVLMGMHQNRDANAFVLIYDLGIWSIGYQPSSSEDTFPFLESFDNLSSPSQHFQLSISGDGMSISLSNDQGFEYHHTLKEKLFDPAEFVRIAAAIGPQRKITLSSLVVSQAAPENPGRPAMVYENLVENPDLPDWIDDFVNVYGGTIILKGTELNSSQLNEAIRADPEAFIAVREIKGEQVHFLEVNGTPLAIKGQEGGWQQATIKQLASFVNLKIGTLISTNEGRRDWWGSEYHLGTATIFMGDIGRGISTPDSTAIDFDWPDYQTFMARRNGMETRFHAVLFPQDLPPWLRQSPSLEALDGIVRLEVEHARERQIEEIVVVNEAGVPSGWDHPDILWQQFGIEYVIRAFKLAREIYPEARLIYNDTGNHIPNSHGTKITRQIANRLFELGLIDYVGIQMHLEDPDFSPPRVADIVKIFQAYPVPVVITEFDVNLTRVPLRDHDRLMNRMTEIVFDSCLESQVCLGITTWGENDSVGWGGRSQLRDRDNARKQAYYVAMQSLYEHIP